jgi:hypothetical protein
METPYLSNAPEAQLIFRKNVDAIDKNNLISVSADFDQNQIVMSIRGQGVGHPSLSYIGPADENLTAKAVCPRQG